MWKKTKQRQTTSKRWYQLLITIGLLRNYAGIFCKNREGNDKKQIFFYCMSVNPNTPIFMLISQRIKKICQRPMKLILT